MAEKPAEAPKGPPAPQPESPSRKPPRVVERGQKTAPAQNTVVGQRARPTLGPPRVVVHGAWGRALPPPLPGEKEESIFTSWLMGLLGRPHPRALAEDEARKAPRR